MTDRNLARIRESNILFTQLLCNGASMKKFLVFLLVVAGCATLPTQLPAPIPSPSPSASPSPNSTELPRLGAPAKRIIGFTVDDPWQTGPILKTLKAAHGKAGLRVVFDEGVKASEYVEILKAYKPHAWILGELLDSASLKDCDVSCYEKRAKDYAAIFPLYDVLEVGNEVNGDWVGSNVVEKISRAVAITKGTHIPVAITLYMDEQETWKAWARKLTPELRAQFDYAFMSHYPDDNNGHEPNWDETARMMGELFPNAELGIGEMGPGESRFKGTAPISRMAIASRYWRLPVDHPKWIGFGGYWYGSQELKKYQDQFVNTLMEAMK